MSVAESIESDLEIVAESESQKKLKENYHRLVWSLGEVKGKLLSCQITLSQLEHKESALQTELKQVLLKAQAEQDKEDRRKAKA